MGFNRLFQSKLNYNLRFVVGVIFIVIAMIVFVDQYLQSGWITLVAMPLTSLVVIAGGIRFRKTGLLIAGNLLFGIGLGIFFVLYDKFSFLPQLRIGIALISFGIGWMLIPLLNSFFASSTTWWALLPGGVIASIGGAFLFSRLRPMDFVLFGVTGLGFVMLLAGAWRRMFGLIIPGALLIGIGPGISLAWEDLVATNPLAQTGLMLIWFSLGWGVIVLFSRIVTTKFIWWPLIPGGVLAMVGWGLYIGGDPDNAISVIGNSWSIGLIIFGLYLLLLRRGMRQ